MSSDDEDDFEEDTTQEDEWEQFRDGDGDFIGREELKQLDLQAMPEDVRVPVLANYFPETTLWRDGEFLVGEIQEHLYTKYWEHKFSAYAFADAMVRAIRRLAHEGHPLSHPSRDDDDDVHIFVRWQLKVPNGTPAESAIEAIKAAFDLVWQRADAILENSDSVLILGKDTGPALERLKRIEQSCRG